MINNNFDIQKYLHQSASQDLKVIIKSPSRQQSVKQLQNHLNKKINYQSATDLNNVQTIKIEGVKKPCKTAVQMHRSGFRKDQSSQSSNTKPSVQAHANTNILPSKYSILNNINIFSSFEKFSATQKQLQHGNCYQNYKDKLLLKLGKDIINNEQSNNNIIIKNKSSANKQPLSSDRYTQQEKYFKILNQLERNLQGTTNQVQLNQYKIKSQSTHPTFGNSYYQQRQSVHSRVQSQEQNQQEQQNLSKSRSISLASKNNNANDKQQNQQQFKFNFENHCVTQSKFIPTFSKRSHNVMIYSGRFSKLNQNSQNNKFLTLSQRHQNFLCENNCHNTQRQLTEAKPNYINNKQHKIHTENTQLSRQLTTIPQEEIEYKDVKEFNNLRKYYDKKYNKKQRFLSQANSEQISEVSYHKNTPVPELESHKNSQQLKTMSNCFGIHQADIDLQPWNESKNTEEDILNDQN